MTGWRHRIAVAAPVAVGVVLLVVTLARSDVRTMWALASRIGFALPIALLPSAAWHLLRTAAWQTCFGDAPRPSFWRAFRVRLAAEAFSFVTVSGLAGDPLKVVLLYREVPPAAAATAVALERILYLSTTITIVGVAAAIAALMLPLSRLWFSVYATVAVCAPVVLLLSAAALIYWRRRPRAIEPNADAPRVSKARTIVRDLDRHLHDTIRRRPRRIAIAALFEAVAYGAMALEVWLALWTANVPIAWADAIAVETFTRVASMATAFIPAGVGALEASNVAGAAAVHVAAGGLALALIRRVRGLVWCAIGFLVYPSPRRRVVGPGRTAPRAAVVLDAEHGVAPSAALGGLPIAERIARAAARAEYDTLIVWSFRRADAWRTAARRLQHSIVVNLESNPVAWRERIATLAGESAVTVIGPGIVASPAVLRPARADDPACDEAVREVRPDGRSTGVYRMMPARLESPDALIAALRARTAAPPLTFSVTTPGELASAERALRASLVKPTDGWLAVFNRRLSIPLSVALIRLTRLNANAMSALILVLGIAAGWLFSRGDYASGLLAALVSWASSVLDGCDGELARLQYTESAFGCWVDTLGDYTYYVAIFTGLTVGSVRASGSPVYWWVGAALGAGLLLTFLLLIVLRRRITAGRPEQLNANAKAHFYRSGKRWQWLVAKLSNCATRATMPYGILALAAANLLPVLLVLGAIGTQIYWLSLTVELRRLLANQPADHVYGRRTNPTPSALSSAR
jgi:phosphatidylglycerophosphate synthase